MTARDTVSMYSSKPNMFPPRKFLCDTWRTHNRWQQYLTTYILHAGFIYRSVSMVWVPTPSGRISKKHRCFLHVFLSLHIVNFHQKLLLDLRHLLAVVLFTFLSWTSAALIISSYLSYQTSAKVSLCFGANHTCANAHTLQEPRSWIWLQWTGTIICQLKISCAIWLPSHFTS